MITTIPDLKPGSAYRVQFAGRTADGTQTEWTNTFTLNVPAGVPHAAPTGGTVSYTTGNINFAWTDPVKTADFQGYVVDVYTPGGAFLSRFPVGTQPTFNFTLALNDALSPLPIPNPTIRVYSQNQLGGLSTTPLIITSSYPAMTTFATPTSDAVPSGINWKWSPPAVNGDIVWYYEVDVDANPTVATLNDIEAKVYGLNYLYVGNPNTQYNMLVRATDVFNRGLVAAATATNTTGPVGGTSDTLAPTGVPAANITATTTALPMQKFSLNLDWTAYVPAENISKYIIDWGTTVSGSYPNTTSVTAQTAQIVIPRTAAAGTVFLRIRPVDLAGNISTTATEKTVASVPVMAGIPGSFNLNWNTPTLVVTWTAPSTALGLLSDVIGYNVTLTNAAGTVSRTYYTPALRLDWTPDMNRASGLAASPAIYANILSGVSVKAVYDTGAESAATSTLSTSNSFNGTPGAPVLSADTRQFYASWTGMNDAVEYVLASDATTVISPPTTVRWRGASLNATWPVTGVLTYKARVKGVNILGTESNYSNESNSSTALIADVTAPSDISATGSSLGSATDSTDPSGGTSTLVVNWVGSASSDVAGHKVRYAPDTTTEWTYVDVIQQGALGSTQTLTIRGLAAGSKYLVQVAAYDRDSNMSPTYISLIGSPKTLASDATDPTTMTAINFRTSNNYITFFWNELADADVTKGRGRYEVQLDTSISFGSGAVKTNMVTGLVTAFHGLLSNTPYYVRIRAYDAGGRFGAWYQYPSAVYTTLQDTTTISGGNRLKNSSFKDGINSGTLVGGVVQQDFAAYNAAALSLDAATGRSDNSAMKVTVNNAAIIQGAIFFTPIEETVQPNQNIVVSAWVKGDASSIGQVVRIGSRFCLPGTTTYQSEQTLTLAAVTLSATWQRVSFKYATPGVLTRPGMQVVFLNAQPLATQFWIDDIQLEVSDTLTNYTPRGDEILKNAIINEMILANNIEADRIKTNTTFTQNVYVGDVLDTGANAGGITVRGTAGYIRSQLNVTDSAQGYKLTNAGLDILTGTIGAKAIVLKDGTNLVSPAYSGFDQGSMADYTSKLFALPSTQLTDIAPAVWGPVPGGVAINSLCFNPSGSPTTSNNGFWLGPTDTSYNIPVEAGQTYTYSVYLSNYIGASALNLAVKYNNGGGVSTGITTNAGWARKSMSFTVPASGVSSVLLGVNGATGGTWWISGIQLEKNGVLTPFRSPAATYIDGGQIKTGQIVSYNSKNVNGILEPYWAINTDGRALFQDAVIRGSAIVGKTFAATPTAWSSATAYTVTNPPTYVSYNGKIWQVMAASTNVAPVNGAQWQETTTVIAPVPWSSTTTYDVYNPPQYVTSGGKIWQAIAYSSNVTPVEGAQWKQVVDPDGGNSVVQSANYVPASAGWRIKSNGDAEFNAGTFRGAVTATSFNTIGVPQTVNSTTTTPNIEITSGAGNYLKFKAGYPGETLYGRIQTTSVGSGAEFSGRLLIYAPAGNDLNNCYIDMRGDFGNAAGGNLDEGVIYIKAPGYVNVITGSDLGTFREFRVSGAMRVTGQTQLNQSATLAGGLITNTWTNYSASALNVKGLSYGTDIETQGNTAPLIASAWSGVHSTNVALIRAYRASNSAYDMIDCVAAYTTTPDSVFRVRGDGRVSTDYGSGGGSINNATGYASGGADYAEYFEWVDGNPDSEDRAGISVVLEGSQVRPALDTDAPEDIIGVVSVSAVIAGDAADFRWVGKFELDEFGRKQSEPDPSYYWVAEDGTERWSPVSLADPEVPEDAVIITEDEDGKLLERYILSEDFDPEAEYVSREFRKEWTLIGLVGKLLVRKGQPVGPRWLLMETGEGTKPDRYLLR